jgi:hypothetical protein
MLNEEISKKEEKKMIVNWIGFLPRADHKKLRGIDTMLLQYKIYRAPLKTYIMIITKE